MHASRTTTAGFAAKSTSMGSTVISSVVPVDKIVKSMIFDAGGELVLALTSGCNQVDPIALAGIAGVERCEFAGEGLADADLDTEIGGQM